MKYQEMNELCKATSKGIDERCINVHVIEHILNPKTRFLKPSQLHSIANAIINDKRLYEKER